MFSVTSLGHQGWLVGSERTRVLIDPILGESFARLPLTRASMFPPRRFDFAVFPAVDAVLISHEHPDHLDFASLQRIDRRVPIYLSAHASDAARRVITSLGFDVRALAPGIPWRIGDLDVLPLAPDVIGEPGENEVDIVPLVVRHSDGNFFTSVDIVQTVAMVEEVRRHIDRPGVWTYANNAIDLASCYEWLGRPADPVAKDVSSFLERYVSLFSNWGHPEVTLVNGDGALLGGDLASLNPHVFTVDGAAMCEALKTALPGHSFQHAIPGVTVEMVEGEIMAIRKTAPFLEPAPRAEWSPRGGEPLVGAIAANFEPATGRKRLESGEERKLDAALQDFARFLFARPTYRGLYRLMAERDHPTRQKPTLAIALRMGDPVETRVWEFHPQRCSFERVEITNPRDHYVAGGEFWASDFLDVLTFRALADDVFHFGRKRLWNAAPASFRCDLDTEIQLFAHALRAGAQIEALYSRCLDPRAAVVVTAGVAAGESTERFDPGPLVRRHARERPLPADLTAKSRVVATTPGRPPVSEAELSGWRASVASVCGDAWTLTRGERSGETIRAFFSSEEGPLMVEATRWNPSKPFYKRVGPLAFSYSPGSMSAGSRPRLDRVIVALANEFSKGINRTGDE